MPHAAGGHPLPTLSPTHTTPRAGSQRGYGTFLGVRPFVLDLSRLCAPTRCSSPSFPLRSPAPSRRPLPLPQNVQSLIQVHRHHARRTTAHSQPTSAAMPSSATRAAPRTTPPCGARSYQHRAPAARHAVSAAMASSAATRSAAEGRAAGCRAQQARSRAARGGGQRAGSSGSGSWEPRVTFGAWWWWRWRGGEGVARGGWLGGRVQVSGVRLRIERAAGHGMACHVRCMYRIEALVVMACPKHRRGVAVTCPTRLPPRTSFLINPACLPPPGSSLRTPAPHATPCPCTPTSQVYCFLTPTHTQPPPSPRT